ncbi:hypothetical protein Tco_0279419 [Tanacetum coccineum]
MCFVPACFLLSYSLSKDLGCVCYESRKSQSNPSPCLQVVLLLAQSRPLKVFGLSDCQVGMGYKVGVSWEVYGEAMKCTMEVVWQENSG